VQQRKLEELERMKEAQRVELESEFKARMTAELAKSAVE